MKTLLEKLQSVLSKVDGNYMTREEPKYDEFYCVKCHQRVYEDQYNHKNSQCFECFYSEEK